jgi:ArsR family transcriptional regulator
MSPYNDTFKALADPSRREIIRYLKERSMTAGEIADKFDYFQTEHFPSSEYP